MKRLRGLGQTPFSQDDAAIALHGILPRSATVSGEPLAVDATPMSTAAATAVETMPVVMSLDAFSLQQLESLQKWTCPSLQFSLQSRWAFAIADAGASECSQMLEG
eukprot:15468341-Alexandrium_andersonii.AAC.1